MNDLFFEYLIMTFIVFALIVCGLCLCSYVMYEVKHFFKEEVKNGN